MTAGFGPEVTGSWLGWYSEVGSGAGRHSRARFGQLISPSARCISER